MGVTESKDIAAEMARDCLSARLRLINRVITSVYDEALRPLGIRVSQMNILVAVASYGPINPSTVCRALHLDPSTLSRNLERMKKKGWMEIVPGPDARTHLLRVTRGGLQTIQAAYPAWAKAQTKALSILGQAGADTIAGVGDKLLFSGVKTSGGV